VKVRVAIAALLVSAPALATPTKSECVDANTRGQEHRIAKKLHTAREDFATCATASCPELVRNDCRERLAEVNRSMPSIVVVVPPAQGAFLTLDGASIPLDQAPLDADPGEHELTLNVPGNAPVTHRITLAERERQHRDVFPALVSRAVRAEPDVQKPHGTTPPLRIAGIVTGAVALVGVGFGAAFGVAGFGAWNSAKTECSGSTCNLAPALADRSHALDFATASDVAFVVSGVLLAAGVTMFFLGHATVSASRDRVAFVLRGTF
jgi:hypothetical protein